MRFTRPVGTVAGHPALNACADHVTALRAVITRESGATLLAEASTSLSSWWLPGLLPGCSSILPNTAHAAGRRFIDDPKGNAASRHARKFMIRPRAVVAAASGVGCSRSRRTSTPALLH